METVYKYEKHVNVERLIVEIDSFLEDTNIIYNTRITLISIQSENPALEILLSDSLPEGADLNALITAHEITNVEEIVTHDSLAMLKFGQELLFDFKKEMGLTPGVTKPQLFQVAVQYYQIQNCLFSGNLAAARYLMSTATPYGPVTQNVLNSYQSKITSFIATLT